MQGYVKINLRDMANQLPDNKLQEIVEGFSCPYNVDVEDFLCHKAMEFSKQRLASTYLVFASYKEKPCLVGYFALASKYFHVDLKRKGSNSLNSKLRHRMSKFATYDEELQKYIIAAPLIAQLGKNYAYDYDKLISGDELLKIACDTVKEAQSILGGKMVYLECEDVPSLLRFYEENGFVSFGRRELDADETGKLKGKYLIQLLKYMDVK